MALAGGTERPRGAGYGRALNGRVAGEYRVCLLPRAACYVLEYAVTPLFE